MLRQLSFVTVLAIVLSLCLMSCATSERGIAYINTAIGDYSVDYGSAEDDVGAALSRFMVEVMEPGEINAGLSVEYTPSVDDDLFENETGIMEKTDSEMFDAFVYWGVMFASDSGKFTMPLRLGAFGQYLELEDTAIDSTWKSFGPRISLEPRFLLWDNGKNDLTLYGEGNVGYGWGNVRFRIPNDRDDDDVKSMIYGGEVGLRFSFSKSCFGGLSYIYRMNDYEESDDSKQPETSAEFSGVALTIGAKF